MAIVTSGRPAPSLRGALLGFGFIAESGHAPAYALRERGLGDFAIVALADVCEARRQKARATFPRARVYEDHRALLAAEVGRIDFVDIATPPSEHAALAHAAFDRGLHVLCEKPLSTTAESARELLEHARRAERVLFPCHNYKHAPVLRRVRELVDGEAIGRVRLVTLDTFRPTSARGVAEWRPDWRRERQFAGGGIAMDHGSHTFYLALDWLRDAPLGIAAKATRLGQHDTEDNFTCTVTFPAALAVAHLSWTAGVRKVIYTLHGDRGALRVEDDELEFSTFDRGRTGSRVRETVPSEWLDASHAGWFDALLGEFSAAIRTGLYVGPDAEQAYQCVRLIAAGYASDASGGAEVSLTRDRFGTRTSACA